MLIGKLIKCCSIKEGAAVTLLCALLLPVFSLVSVLSLALAERIEAEYAAARILKVSGQLALAAYSRQLWNSYGLFGLREADIDLTAAEEILDNLPEIIATQISCEVSEDLFSGELLKEQIIRYMRWRAPLVLSNNALHRLRSAATDRINLQAGNAYQSLQNAHHRQDASGKYLAGREDINKLENMAEYSTEEPAAQQSEVPDEQEENTQSAAEDTDLEALQPILQHFSRYMLPVYEAFGTEKISQDDAFSPAMIEGLASKLDYLLDQGLGADWEQLCLAEYALMLFPARINLERVQGGHYELYTPDGRSLSSLAKDRDRELEQIVAQTGNPDQASRHCEHLIMGMRFIPRYIAAQKNPSLQASYRKWAEIISVAIQVLSLGEIVIPADVLIYFVQAAHCLWQARNDTQELIKGQGLAFWPPDSTSYIGSNTTYYTFYYRDYLRLILLTRNADGIVQELGRLIQKEVPGTYYVSLKVSLEANRRTICYAFTYREE